MDPDVNCKVTSAVDVFFIFSYFCYNWFMPKINWIELVLTSKKWFEKNLFYLLAVFLLLFWYSLFLLKDVNLVTADLGRHLKNGELFLQNFQVPAINLYSYTYPDFPFTNHHWGAGVVFFLIEKFSGLAGLSSFFIALSLLTFWIFLRLAEKMSSFFVALPAALLAIPLLGERTEIRPEVFSYFFAGLFLWLLWHFQKGRLSFRWLFLLPLIESLWVNSHIYFFLGFLILGSFWMEDLFSERKNLKKLTLILFLTALAALINPFGIQGLIYPFLIFGNYGYRIVENQTVWFLERLQVFHANFPVFKAALILLGISFLALLIGKRKKFSLAIFLPLIALTGLTLMAIRNFTLWGLFLIPGLGYLWENLKIKTIPDAPLEIAVPVEINYLSPSSWWLALKFWERRGIKITAKAQPFILFFGTVLIFALTFFLSWNDLPVNQKLPDNFFSKINAPAEFFKKEHLQGPIFNNYDVGGFLIFHLYPQEKVFVDNRPEAYPQSFFDEVYIPMQEKEADWQKAEEKYQFNVIFFYRNDYTPWGQQFLISRIQDKTWAPVFVDQQTIIFLKRNSLNQDIITHFEIPAENFNIIKP